MARQLATLLGRGDDRLLLLTLRDLELKTGSKGIDVTLLGDILHTAHAAMRLVGLDPVDSTAREVYQALQNNVSRLTDESLAYSGLVLGGELVSFNPYDIAEDTASERTFETRTALHLQRALATEISARYLAAAYHHEKIVKRLLEAIPSS